MRFHISKYQSASLFKHTNSFWVIKGGSILKVTMLFQSTNGVLRPKPNPASRGPVPTSTMFLPPMPSEMCPAVVNKQNEPNNKGLSGGSLGLLRSRDQGNSLQGTDWEHP